MKVGRIKVTISRTIQMRSFEPLTIYGEAEAQVDPDEKAEKAFETLRNLVRKQMDKEIELRKDQRKETLENEQSNEKAA